MQKYGDGDTNQRLFDCNRYGGSLELVFTIIEIKRIGRTVIRSFL